MTDERGSITIDPQDATVSVDILAGGASAIAYTTETGATTVSFPSEISDETVYWVARRQAYTVVVSLNGTEVMRESVGVGLQAVHDPHLTVSLAEFTTGEASAALGGGGGGGGGVDGTRVALDVSNVSCPNDGTRTGVSGFTIYDLDSPWATLEELPAALGLTLTPSADVVGDDSITADAFTADEDGFWVVTWFANLTTNAAGRIRSALLWGDFMGGGDTPWLSVNETIAPKIAAQGSYLSHLLAGEDFSQNCFYLAFQADNTTDNPYVVPYVSMQIIRIA